MSFKSEIVIGFVGPVGVDSRKFHELAQKRLGAFRYKAPLIKVSEEIDKLQTDGYLKTKLVTAPEFERIESHMKAGDELRRLAEEKCGKDARGVLAYAVATTIGKQRTLSEDNRSQTLPMAGHAWLVSSLKNPTEVEILRSIYREGFFLIGLYASETDRRKALELRGMSKAEATELIKQDLEGGMKSGQQTRKTFELADAWVETEEQLVRVLELIFGNSFQTPSDDENAMSLAYSEAMRSSDLSRQVGAAIVLKSGELIATGRNEVPASGGGQYSPAGGNKTEKTARDCDVGEDYNQKERTTIQQELVDDIGRLVNERMGAAILDDEQVSTIKGIVTESLQQSRLHEITEYGRAVHAEMSALMAATKVGISVKDATLYCTTFPCHNCAKHIVASGIKRVVFVEPYPKSKAMALHADAIELVGEEVSNSLLSAATKGNKIDRVTFEPFVGVGPRRYFDLFSMNLGFGRAISRKDSGGKKLTFQQKEATPRVPLATLNYLDQEIIAADNLSVTLDTFQGDPDEI